jgi:5'-AMP-activated protein kinase regulatory beta subunit
VTPETPESPFASEPTGTSDTLLHTQDLLPVLFEWNHGGDHVYIIGSFNSWNGKIPMERSGDDFSYTQLLTRDRHTYKFIVDDIWRTAHDQTTITDYFGNVNNVIDLTIV